MLKHKTCKFCGKEYDCGNLAKHLKNKHNIEYKDYILDEIVIDENDELQCRICKRKNKSLGGFKNHLSKTHKMSYDEYMKKYVPESSYHDVIDIDKNNKLQCQICGKILKERSGGYGTSISNHLSHAHDISYDDYMEKYFNEKTKKVLENESYQKVNPHNKLQCQICGKIFKSNKNLGRHIKKTHNMEIEIYEHKYFNIDNKCRGLFVECLNFTKRTGFMKYETHCDQCNKESRIPTQLGFWCRKYNFNYEESKYVRDLYCSKNNVYSSDAKTSKDSQILFWRIYDELDDTIKKNVHFHELNGEFCVTENNKNYLYDFVVTGNIKKCIEFNGDMWHANPSKYSKYDTPNPFNEGLTAQQIWKLDAKKTKVLYDKRDIETMIVWESDYKKDSFKVIEECKRFLGA